MSGPGPRLASGYTLIEILVAVTVFSILAATAYLALDTLSAASAAHRDRAEAFGAVQLAVARLDSDLRQLAARPASSADGRMEPALAGADDRIEGTRAGWANPAAVKRSTLQRFAWRLSGSELERVHWPVTDRVGASRPATETILPGVVDLAFRYRDRTGAWQQSWPAGDDAQARLPTAIEVVLESRHFGTVRRLVVLQ